jgi:hypothetical protein
MKAFVLIACALLLIGGMTACQSSTDVDVENPQQAEQVADSSVDSSIVAEDDDVELGEMV